MIGIIDYGLGNVAAFLTVYGKLNIPAMAVSSDYQFKEVNKLILPGIGAFDEAMNRLKQSSLIPPLHNFACEQRLPVLGVCVGMQLMAGSSEEGIIPGLGWLNASVRKLPSTAAIRLRLPHMGWNDVKPLSSNGLFKGLDQPQFYFLHSYYFDTDQVNMVAAHSYYGEKFVCAVQQDNICGTQFHPEKSHEWGTMLLKNFADL